MAAASAGMHLTKESLRWAKEKGCPAFKGGRVKEAGFWTWWEQHKPEFDPAGLPIALKDQKLAEEVRKLKIANDLKEGKLVSRDLVAQAFKRTGALMDSLLNQKLGNEYPTLVTKLDVAGARVYGKRLSDEIMVEAAKFYKEWDF